MATYQVSARYKKSTVETEYWVHREDSRKHMSKELGWRWGEFTVDLSDEDLECIDTEDEAGEFSVYDYENAELVDCTDGCWEDWTYSDAITDEERAAIEEAYCENYEEGVEELGYVLQDTEVVIHGPIDLELIEE